MHIAEADIDQSLQFLADLRHVGEQRQCVFDREVENIGDGVAMEFNGKRLLIVTA